MAAFEKFEEIEVWKKARQLDLELFQVAESSRIARDFKLRDQMLGSSGSIMDNIAEGFGRGGNSEFIRFLYFSKGSCLELMSQSYRAFDRKYIDEDQLKHFLAKLEEINNKTQALISYLARSDQKGPRYTIKDIKRGEQNKNMEHETQNMKHGA